MLITASAKDLAKAAATAAEMAHEKSNIPILTNLLLTVGEGVASFSGCNLDGHMTATVPAALLEGALAVLNALADTAERPRSEQIDALRAAVRFAEDNNCSDVTDRAFEIALDKLGFTQEEADQQIFLEALGTEPSSRFEQEYLAGEKAAADAWLNGGPPNSGATDQHVGGVSIDDFHAYMPMHQYIFSPARDIWPASSVNARLSKMEEVENGEVKQVTASAWLDRNKPVEQMTWAPGMPMIIRNRLISLGGWIDHNGVNIFNLYRPPTIHLGDPTKASPWIEHLNRIYPDDAKHISLWLAHRVQRPAEKINHALLLAGRQGIGKDTLLEPVKYAVGPWNFTEVAPHQLLGRFNGYLKSVVLRVSEAKGLGEVDRFTLYDRMKTLTAAPPDVLMVDEKNLREYAVPNIAGVVITSNHRLDGVYLPEDDRRHYVAWSDLSKEDFKPAYWNSLWGCYANGGISNVAAYLATLDISSFDPKAPPPRTQAFWDIVMHNQPPEDAELADAIDLLKHRDAITIGDVVTTATGSLAEWLNDRKNRRAIPHRMEDRGYLRFATTQRRTACGLSIRNAR